MDPIKRQKFHTFEEIFKHFNEIQETEYIPIYIDTDIRNLIPSDSKYLNLCFGSSGSGDSIGISTEKVTLDYIILKQNKNEEDRWDSWDSFYCIFNTIMPQILPLLETLDLDLLEIDYNVEDDNGEEFLPYFINFKADNIRYISLYTRGSAVDSNWGILDPKFIEKLYLECSECNQYFKASEIDMNEHTH